MTLHTIVYDKLATGQMAGHIRSLLDDNVDRWLEKHCQGRYYHNPGWTDTKYIQFEDSRDAMLFALRWA